MRCLARLGQGAERPLPTATKPDFVFYTGCNVLKTPHIALLALDIMDALGITYNVMGGPTHCCGILQLRAGDVATSGRVGENTLDKLAQSKTGQVLSWCPSCQVQFTEMTLPTVEKTRGSKAVRNDAVHVVPAQTSRPAAAAAARARADADRAAPASRRSRRGRGRRGHSARRAGHRARRSASAGGRAASNNLKVLPEYRRALDEAELVAAAAAGIDALVAIYHSDHRALCAHERDWPFQILNMYEIVGLSMGLHHEDSFKRLKLMQDADAILADCADLVEHHGLDRETTRLAIQAMLDEQPAPLRRAWPNDEASRP